MFHREGRLTATSFGFRHMNIEILIVRVQGVQIQSKMPGVFSPHRPATPAMIDIPVSTRMMMCVLTVLCRLPSLHNRLSPRLFHCRCSHPCPHILDPSCLSLRWTTVFQYWPRFGGLNSFKVYWRMNRGVWGGS